MKTLTQDFSKEEIKDLHLQLKMMSIVALIAIGIFFFLLYYAYNEGWSIFPIVFLSFFGMIVIGLVYSFIQTRKNLKLGKKEVLIGVLTRKTSSIARDGHFNYFHFGEQIIDLGKHNNEDHYNEIQVGQTVAIERTINLKNILKVEALKETE